MMTVALYLRERAKLKHTAVIDGVKTSDAPTPEQKGWLKANW
jgi:hypothetical protein